MRPRRVLGGQTSARAVGPRRGPCFGDARPPAARADDAARRLPLAWRPRAGEPPAPAPVGRPRAADAPAVLPLPAARPAAVGARPPPAARLAAPPGRGHARHR